jgi:hypothetical protein
MYVSMYVSMYARWWLCICVFQRNDAGDDDGDGDCEDVRLFRCLDAYVTFSLL